jgi:hypothetical protein
LAESLILFSVSGFFDRLLNPHQRLPQGVHPYPTELGRRRFEILVLFNLVLAVYIAIHQLFMPLTLWILQTRDDPMPTGLGFWYLYHGAVAVLFYKPKRNPRRLRYLAYLAWFAVAATPLLLIHSFQVGDQVRVTWKAVSGILCYLSSLLVTLFLLYRLRMPTTAYLFGLPDRLLPKWRYAIPSFFLGLMVAVILIRYVDPIFQPEPTVTTPARVPQPNPRAIYQ